MNTNFFLRTVVIHLVDSPEIDMLLEKLVRKRINGLHLLIISRMRPSMNIQELQLKGYCHRLKSALFELSQDEISEYFRLFDLDISDIMAKQIHEMTEGWITAVYLVCQRSLDTGRLEAVIDLYELINTSILGRYTEKEKRLLMSLSIIDSFTLSQAVYITENKLVPGIIHKLSSDNSFIRFDERSQRYFIYNNCLDLCFGYLGGITGDPHSFAPWLQTGEMHQDEIFYHGLAYNYLVHARYVLLKKDYLLSTICVPS